MREAIKQARTKNEGSKIGLQLVSELKDANKSWKKVIEDVELVAKRSGLKRPINVDDFLRIIDDIPEEKLADKLFNLGDKRSLVAIREIFPQVYDAAREAKLAAIIKNSHISGKLSPIKLVNTLNKLDQRTIEFLFDKNKIAVLDDLKLILKNNPEMAGPTKTPEGMELLRMFSPLALANEIPRGVQMMTNFARTSQQIKDPTLLPKALQNLSDAVNAPLNYQNMSRAAARSAIGQTIKNQAVVPKPMTEEDVIKGDYSPTKRAKMINDIRRGKIIYPE
jgi:hypothetical protein